ncbi:MAG: SLATT domain-containing protein [Pseudomonadota bacterium]
MSNHTQRSAAQRANRPQLVRDGAGADRTMPADDELRDALEGLLKKARRVKRARFEAQLRFEAKNRASIVALTLVSIMAISIEMYGGTHQSMPEFAALRPSLDFMASAMSLLVLAFGFIVALGSYQDKALRMQACALDLTRLADEIAIMKSDRQLNRAAIFAYAERYNDIMQQCPYNHSDVDFAKATIRSDAPIIDKARVTMSYIIDVWGIHLFFVTILASAWAVIM